jgi:hypothetical protein
MMRASIHGGMPMKLHFAAAAKLLAFGVLCLAGCNTEFFTGEKRVPPPPLEYSIQSPYPNTLTIAIAPAINLSGSRDFDVLSVSDTLHDEMQQVAGINVLTVNKTLIAMQQLGMRSIEDPRAAQRLAQFLNADGLVIPAITSYDPYNPPKVGMVLQLYTPPGSPLTAPPAEETPAVTNPGSPTIVADVVAVADRQPISQVEGVFNATNQSVLRELRLFAAGRTQYDSALQDQKYMFDADSYMRFVCHAMIRRLLEVERQRLSDR